MEPHWLHHFKENLKMFIKNYILITVSLILFMLRFKSFKVVAYLYGLGLQYDHRLLNSGYIFSVHSTSVSAFLKYLQMETSFLSL